MKKLILLALLIPFVGYCAVEPIVISIAVGQTYTVPTDKVLIIESATNVKDSANANHGLIEIISSGATNGPVVLVSYEETLKGLKIPSQSIIRCVVHPNEGINIKSGPVVMFCILVDQSDLYASLNTNADNFLVQNGIFSFDVKTSSAKPARIFVEGADDLTAGWHPVDSTVEKKSSDIYTVSVATESEDYFAKYVARSRE